MLTDAVFLVPLGYVTLALIVLLPVLIPRTRPLSLTTATSGFELCQVTDPPGASAANCLTPPTRTGRITRGRMKNPGVGAS
jgi:hypothetical protein